MRAAIYARLSAKSDDAENIPQQLDYGRRVVGRRGWEPAGEWVDDGVSAWRDDVTRPAFADMLRAARAGEIEVVVVRDVDRLTRSVADWGDLSRTGVQVATHGGEVLDRFAVTVLAGVASRESDMKSERQRLAEERRVAAGKPPRGGRRHFGYHSGTCCDSCESHEVHEREAEVVREMARRWLGGEAMRALARELNERGVPTTGGGEWTHKILKKMLLSPRLAAIRVHRGEEVRGQWEPVLDEETHARLLEADSRSGTRRAPVPFLLTGVLVCGAEGCGATLNGHTHHPTGKRRYACLSCRGVGIGAEPVEEHLWNEALARVWRHDREGQRRVEERLAEVEEALRGARAALEELDDAYWQERTVDKRTYTRQSAALRERAAGLEAESARLRDERERESGFWRSLMGLADTYETAPAHERRKILRRALARVVVAPWEPDGSNEVDLGRLRPEWAIG